jgi:hypothetical protein
MNMHDHTDAAAWPARRDLLGDWIAQNLEEQPEGMRLRRGLALGAVLAWLLRDKYPGDVVDDALVRVADVAKAAAARLAELDGSPGAASLAGPAAGHA